MSSETKKKQLRKHKRIATGLFVLMAVIYGVMVYLQHHNAQVWMGYLEAFAEAGMVGALADWFAVTALFKHPLGIPIPHTNLIERKQNDLGKNLGKFVNENFMSPQTIRPYIEKIDFVKLFYDWLNKPQNRKNLELELLHLFEKIINDLNDEEVEQFLVTNGKNLLQSVDYAKVSSAGVHYLVQRNEHIHLLESFLPQIKIYIDKNEELILKRLADSRPFIAFLAGKKISREITDGIVAFIEEIEADDTHFVRQKLTKNLKKFAFNLQQDEKWKTKFERLKADLIIPENLRPYAEDAWKSIKLILQKQVETPDSSLIRYIEKSIVKLSANLQQDKSLQNRLNQWLRHFLYRMVLKNRQEIEALISTTVSNWEGRELSQKLELEVGKDLQFIRVNGTLVGGLMGLFIYALTQFFI